MTAPHKEPVRLTAPMRDEDILRLRCGMAALLDGVVFTGRDAAHKRLADALLRGEPLPFDIRGQVIYYAGPCPAKPGRVIGPIGPTTSARMDEYAPILMEHGQKVMIGKGGRGESVVEAIRAHRGVYFSAIGGAAAYLSRCVKESEVVAYPDLGTEAVRRLTVVSFPLVVAIDAYGGSIYNPQN